MFQIYSDEINDSFFCYLKWQGFYCPSLYIKFQHPSQSRQQAFYSSNKLPHVKRQKGRALLVKISTQKFSRQIWAPLYKPLNEGEDDAKIHPNIFRNERRKSCYSWRLRQKETGSRNMNDRASTDSQVFEMIHLDENNEEVSSKDKIVTGSESNLFFTNTLRLCTEILFSNRTAM